MNEPTSNLKGKTIILTGASRGLGRGAAEELSKRGAHVLAVARDRSKLEELARSIPNVEPIAADAADEALAARLVRQKPHAIVLVAGASPVLGPIHEQTWETFNTNWNVDTKSTFVWLREALANKLEGDVIVVASGAAVHGSPVSGGYASAKRAQWFIADYAATEAKRAGIPLRIACVLPMLNSSTELGRAGIAAYAARAGVSPEEFAKRFNPPLTPGVFGRAIADLIDEPARYADLVYRLGGEGLAAFK